MHGMMIPGFLFFQGCVQSERHIELTFSDWCHSEKLKMASIG